MRKIFSLPLIMSAILLLGFARAGAAIIDGLSDRSKFAAGDIAVGFFKDGATGRTSASFYNRDGTLLQTTYMDDAGVVSTDTIKVAGILQDPSNARHYQVFFSGVRARVNASSVKSSIVGFDVVYYQGGSIAIAPILNPNGYRSLAAADGDYRIWNAALLGYVNGAPLALVSIWKGYGVPLLRCYNLNTGAVVGSDFILTPNNPGNPYGGHVEDIRPAKLSDGTRVAVINYVYGSHPYIKVLGISDTGALSEKKSYAYGNAYYWLQHSIYQDTLYMTDGTWVKKYDLRTLPAAPTQIGELASQFFYAQSHTSFHTLRSTVSGQYFVQSSTSTRYQNWLTKAKFSGADVPVFHYFSADPAQTQAETIVRDPSSGNNAFRYAYKAVPFTLNNISPALLPDNVNGSQYIAGNIAATVNTQSGAAVLRIHDRATAVLKLEYPMAAGVAQKGKLTLSDLIQDASRPNHYQAFVAGLTLPVGGGYADCYAGFDITVKTDGTVAVAPILRNGSKALISAEKTIGHAVSLGAASDGNALVAVALGEPVTSGTPWNFNNVRVYDLNTAEKVGQDIAVSASGSNYLDEMHAVEVNANVARILMNNKTAGINILSFNKTNSALSFTRNITVSAPTNSFDIFVSTFSKELYYKYDQISREDIHRLALGSLTDTTLWSNTEPNVYALAADPNKIYLLATDNYANPTYSLFQMDMASGAKLKTSAFRLPQGYEMTHYSLMTLMDPSTLNFGVIGYDEAAAQPSYFTVNNKDGVNAVQNPGFEQDKANWTFPANGVITAAQYHSGAKSARLYNSAAQTSTIQTPKINVKASTPYLMRLWMLEKPQSGYARVVLNWYNSAGSSVGNQVVVKGVSAAQTSWLRYEASVLAPATAASVSVRLQLYNGTGYVWYDDVHLSEQPGGSVLAAPSLAAAGEWEYDSEPQASPASTAASDLTRLKIYPNPFRPGSGSNYDAPVITFSGLTQDVRIAIYGMTGEKVAELFKDDNTDALTWDARSSSGDSAASGTYLCRISNSKGEKRTGKLAIIR